MSAPFEQAAGRVSIKNNGKGIPVVMHKEHGIYVPELIFGACPLRRWWRARGGGCVMGG